MAVKLHTSLVFSLAWDCGYCNNRIPVLTATDDHWLICPRCGTKYDLADTHIAPNQRAIMVALDAAGIPYVGGKIE